MNKFKRVMHNKSVFVFDEDNYTCKFFKFLLCEFLVDYHIHTNVLRAMDILNSRDFDMYIINFKSPHILKSRILQKLKNYKQPGHLIIVVNAWEKAQTDSFSNFSRVVYVKKPFNLLKIRILLNKILNQ